MLKKSPVFRKKEPKALEHGLMHLTSAAFQIGQRLAAHPAPHTGESSGGSFCVASTLHRSLLVGLVADGFEARV